MSSKETIWTPANIVTIIRICGIPVFVVALISPWPEWFPTFESIDALKPWVATILFLVLAFTDTLDGYLARSRNEVTTFGKLIDPLADKILVAAALISLVELNILPSWVVLVILAREFIVSGVRMIAATEGFVIAASIYGKVKTVLQMTAITLFIIKEAFRPLLSSDVFGYFYIFCWVIMIAALAMTIISLCDYLYKARSLFGFDKKSIRNSFVTPEEVIEILKEQSLTVCTAESITGGLIAGTLTSVSGSSAVVRGGIVSYATDIKKEILHVDENILNTNGAVSENTVIQMAEHARDMLKADIAVAVSGIAGPLSDDSGQPVGTVWMAISSKGKINASLYNFEGNREEIRQQCIRAALIAIKDAALK